MIPTLTFLGSHAWQVSFSMRQIQSPQVILTLFFILTLHDQSFSPYSQNTSDQTSSNSIPTAAPWSKPSPPLASLPTWPPSFWSLLPSVCSQHSSQGSRRFKSAPITPYSNAYSIPTLTQNTSQGHQHLDLDLDLLSFPLSPPLLWSTVSIQPYLPLFVLHT